VNYSLWLHNLAAWSAQATVLIGAGSLAVWAFRIRMARIRLVCAQALLAICLLLPMAQPWQSGRDSQVDFSTSAARPADPRRPSPRAFPWREVLLIALASGSAARALWLAVGFGKLRRRRRTSRPLDPLPVCLDRLRAALVPGAASRAEFLVSPSIPGPVTFGFWRPVIVLPARFAEMPANIQQAIACHELLHVRRHDWIVTLAEESIRAALWFHPAVWWLIGQIQLAREQTVDGAVVEFTKDRAQYLNALLAIAGDQPAPDLAPATLFLRKRHLKKRVALLLKEITMSKRSIISFCAASCGLLFAAGWFALHTFPLQAAPVPQEQVESNLLHSVPPQYPREAREKHIEGSVALELQVDANGHVSDAHVVSGPQELRSAALQAVLQWHYSPKTMTLPATTQVTVEFKLPKEGESQAPKIALPPGTRFTVKTIHVRSLSASATDELLQQLPVHFGDSIDAAGVQALVENVRAFDDDLQVSVSPDRSNQLEISIAPAGTQEQHAQSAEPKKIRVGGNAQQTKLLVQTKPNYPPEAKAKGIQGAVVLEATIGKDGKVENLQVLSGEPLLAAAALDAVRSWQYSTTLLNGDPVEVVTNIDVNFTLAP
jgi:TonB family protein